MNERQRRAYLAAMEIPLWLPREREDSVVDEVAVPPPTVEVPPVLTALAQQPDNWDSLAAQVATCRQCPELAAGRTHTVFGVGDQQAALMVIGEAPGADEDRQGEPFVGRAGQLLNQMLRALGLEREQVFIANILKCRPPGNRDPHASEAQNCLPYLQRQLELLQPRLVLAVGRIAAQQLLQTAAPLGQLRSQIHFYGERRLPLIVTYHPAYLLRSPKEKARAWQDLQRVLRALRSAHQ